MSELRHWPLHQRRKTPAGSSASAVPFRKAAILLGFWHPREPLAPAIDAARGRFFRAQQFVPPRIAPGHRACYADAIPHPQGMIRKSGYRFSEKIMLKQRDRAG